MSELTPDDVLHWDIGVIDQIFRSTTGLHDVHERLGDALADAQQRTADWRGEAGEAFHTDLGKQRKDIEASGLEAKEVATAVRRAEADVRYCRDQMREIVDKAQANGWVVRPDWTIDAGLANAEGRKHDPELLQNDLMQVKVRAFAADHELGVAVRAAVGEAQVDADGNVVGAPPEPGDPRTTPADQLPLPTSGGEKPFPTEATRDNNSPDVSHQLADNPNPSPLLSGLSADRWRERLAHFQPGDPLPDPRTPTGDKAIDALAYAAGQQNTTYAWGANKSTDGPSAGQPDNGRGANKYHDWDRYGYDCGGLVRYSVQQGAGFDTGMGTDAIDRNSRFGHPGGGLTSAEAVTQAQAGDVLVFGGSDEYLGRGTDHTGIYIGNGFMVNAPQSGEPVRVDPVRGHGTTDILRVP